jgi:hypothetical protein
MSYDELIKVVYEYEKNIPKQRSNDIHTINEFKSEPFQIKHVFQNNSSDNSDVTAAIVAIILIIVITFLCIFLSKKIFK